MNNEQVFTGVKKVAALSDIHGQYELFIRLLKSNQIIDDNKNWNFGKGHFVIVGDVFDRGDKVTETLWFLYHLEQQAEQAGGKVHLLLGNYEIMVLKADLRYLNEKYETVSEIMGLGYEQLFSDETVLGHWLRTKPVVVSINDVAYTHGGLSMALVENNISLEKINALFHNSIIDHDKEEIMENDQLRLLIKSNGPIWYRGYFKDEQFNKTQIETILDHFNCKKIVVGHTSMDEVMPHFDGLVFNVDSSIKKGENGEILLYENSQWYRGILNGNRIKL